MTTEQLTTTEAQLAPVAVGFHDMPAARYHADPCAVPSLSSSVAHTLLTKSALHAWTEHPKLGKVAKEATAEMDFGSLAHETMLGKGGGVTIWEGKDWRGKEAQGFKELAETAGLLPVKRADVTRAEEAVAAWRKQLDAFGLGRIFAPDEGVSEKVAIWQDGGVTCRAMIDRLLVQRGEIWDLKTMSQSAHPKACAARIASLGYDMRSEFYKRGVSVLMPELQGRLKFGFIFAETSPPYAITPVLELDGLWRMLGVSKVGRAVEAWGKCLAANQWPAYVTKPIVAEAPKWALDSEFGAEVLTPNQQDFDPDNK